MHRPPSGWQYQHIDSSRLQELMRQATLEELVDEILSAGVINHINLREPCEDAKREGRIAHRVSFVLRPVSEGAGGAADRLLNGAYGLRARYCHSPDEGRAANSAVCNALADAIHRGTIQMSLSKHDLLALSNALGDSLGKASAKVWFDSETDKRAATSDDGRVTSDVWSQSRNDPKRVERAFPELSPHQVGWSLIKGLSVPVPVAIDVKAAFVESNRTEYIPASKKSRTLQLHLMGWT